LPCRHALYRPIGNGRNGLLRYFRAVDLGQVCGDLSRGQPLRRQRHHQIIDPRQPPLTLRHNPGLTRGLPTPVVPHSPPAQPQSPASWAASHYANSRHDDQPDHACRNRGDRPSRPPRRTRRPPWPTWVNKLPSPVSFRPSARARSTSCRTSCSSKPPAGLADTSIATTVTGASSLLRSYIVDLTGPTVRPADTVEHWHG
jgi:hypothetical protein